MSQPMAAESSEEEEQPREQLEEEYEDEEPAHGGRGGSIPAYDDRFSEERRGKSSPRPCQLIAACGNALHTASSQRHAAAHCLNTPPTSCSDGGTADGRLAEVSIALSAAPCEEIQSCGTRYLVR